MLHKILHKMFAILFGITTAVFAVSYTVSAASLYSNSNFPYTDDNYQIKPTTDIGKEFAKSNQQGSLLERFLNLFGINYADNGQGKAIAYVQILINYVLALLGFIALVMILYSFYMIFFGKSDDQISKARKTVLWSAVALFVVALSAYIVNFVFYVYNKGL